MKSNENDTNDLLIKDFNAFNLHPALLKAVSQLSYEKPTPVQSQAIPVILQGHDVMGAAQTGTGKTAAFVLPILHRLMPYANNSVSPARHPVRALILVPTRELADQVARSVQQYSQYSYLRSAVVFGGVDMEAQTKQLQEGCELLVATPGRLLDHLKQRHLNLNQVSVLVLDEADRMLDMGFLPDLSRIVKALPKQRQGLLFSATFSSEIRRLSRDFLNHPVEIQVTSRNTAAESVTQYLLEVKETDKQAALVQLLKDKSWLQTIVFANTRIGAERLAHFLKKQSFVADAIHGDKNQSERMRILEEFKQEKLAVLVATDVAARGLDIAGVSAVVNFELPFQAEDYVHRIGRTGRAGAQGEAYALYDKKKEQKQLEAIEKLIGRQIKQGPPIFIAPVAYGRQSHRHRHEEDPIFYQPYEPDTQREKPQTQRQTKQVKGTESSAIKSPVGILLGDKPHKK